MNIHFQCIGFFLSLIIGVSNANAATCFCKLSTDNLSGLTAATGVVKDLTGTVNKTYLTQGAFQQDSCNLLCRYAIDAMDKTRLAADFCAAGVPLGSNVSAFASVGTKIYRISRDLGQLSSSRTISTQYFCPSGWLANPTNIDGGEATDNLCKKLAAQPISISPTPSDGTALGTWGFTWGNALYAWGTAANGGVTYRVQTYSQQPVCHF